VKLNSKKKLISFDCLASIPKTHKRMTAIRYSPLDTISFFLDMDVGYIKARRKQTALHLLCSRSDLIEMNDVAKCEVFHRLGVCEFILFCFVLFLFLFFFFFLRFLLFLFRTSLSLLFSSLLFSSLLSLFLSFLKIHFN
jgi:hypothetical protein